MKWLFSSIYRFWSNSENFQSLWCSVIKNICCPWPVFEKRTHSLVGILESQVEFCTQLTLFKTVCSESFGKVAFLCELLVLDDRTQSSNKLHILGRLGDLSRLSVVHLHLTQGWSQGPEVDPPLPPSPRWPASPSASPTFAHAHLCFLTLWIKRIKS